MSVDFASSLGVLEEPGGLETILINAGALTLLAEVKLAAVHLDLEAGSFAVLAVRRFLERASDDDWASLTSGANAKDDALGSVISCILRKAVGDVNEVLQ